MNLANLQSDNGFINVDDMFYRLKNFTPPDDEHYFLQKKQDSSFVKIGLIYYGVPYDLFLVYAGNPQIYQFICHIADQAATLIGFRLQIKDQNE